MLGIEHLHSAGLDGSLTGNEDLSEWRGQQCAPGNGVGLMVTSRCPRLGATRLLLAG
jgi:hypothetical protein